ncbi:MAG TPA: aldolase/citrate lyase family protein [Candidatus Bathyarchaeia archaeon]|nr:aldolase/citrate lyase family protein [Candidatus Bathyarchaeia archaeon]
MSASFRDRLLKGEPLLGTLVSLPSPELAEIAAGAGFDWLFLDMEHGALGPVEILRLVQAVREPCACLVRVPENREMWIKKALDTGAAGLIVPHVNSAEEAAQAVSWAKYPPEGCRSVGFSRDSLYGARFQENVETANARTVVVAQVEHIDGVRAIKSILGVRGLDAVFIGPYDLSASMGKPGHIQDADVGEAIGAVAAACLAARVPVGIFSAGGPGAARAVQGGYTLVCAGIDVGLYAEAARGLIREIQPRNP